MMNEVSPKSKQPPTKELYDENNFPFQCYLSGLSLATLLLLPRAINSHLQSWSHIQATSSSLDTQPDPLDAGLASSLASHLPRLTGSPTPSTTSCDLQDFLQKRRSHARKQVAQSVSAMYVQIFIDKKATHNQNLASIQKYYIWIARDR